VRTRKKALPNTSYISPFRSIATPNSGRLEVRPEVEIQNDDLSDEKNPTLTSDTEGTLWTAFEDEREITVYKSVNAGQRWDFAFSVTISDEAGSLTRPDLTYANGSIFLAYLRSTDRDTSIVVLRSGETNAFFTPPLPSEDGNPIDLRVGTDAEDYEGSSYLYLSYLVEYGRGSDSLHFTASYNSNDLGSQWNSPLTIAPAKKSARPLSSNSNPSSIGLDYGGDRLFLTYISSGDEPRTEENNILVRVSSDFGSRFSQATVLSESREERSALDVAASDSSAFVVFTSTASQDSSPAHAVSGWWTTDKGIHWTGSTIAPLDQRGNHAYASSVAHDDANNFFVGYVQSNSAFSESNVTLQQRLLSPVASHVQPVSVGPSKDAVLNFQPAVAGNLMSPGGGIVVTSAPNGNAGVYGSGVSILPPEPDIEVAPPSLTFDVQKGQRQTSSVSITNRGTEALRWTLALYLKSTPAAKSLPLPSLFATSSKRLVSSASHPALGDLTSTNGQQANHRVIVGLDVPLPSPSRRSHAKMQRHRLQIDQAQQAVLQDLSPLKVTSLERFQHLPYLVLRISEPALRRLANHPRVVSIQEDVIVPPSLIESTSIVGAPEAWSRGYTGDGRVIAVLDSGVDNEHPFLSGKVVAEACFSTTDSFDSSTSLCPASQDIAIGPGSGTNCASNIDGCDHGTYVAGAAAGSDDTRSGVAPESQILSIQVFSRFESSRCSDFGLSSPCALSYTSDQIQALEHVYELRGDYNIAAANMSLGNGHFTAPCDPARPGLHEAVEALRSVGIATIAPTGNEGRTDGINAPACISSVVSVASTQDGSNGTTRDAISPFSNTANFVDLLAPGQSITSSSPGGGFANFSGTSMAAPHVAGAWALLKSKRPDASVDEVLAALSTSGRPVEDSRSGNVFPRIQIDDALETTPTLTASVSAGRLAPEATQEVVISADVADLDPGSYTGRAVISSNDPDEPIREIPVDLRVRPNIVSFELDAITVAPDQEAHLPMSVNGFTDVTSFQFTLSWSRNAVRFDTVKTLNLEGLSPADFAISHSEESDTSKLAISWKAPSETGETRVDETHLFELAFRAVGSDREQTTVAFSDDPVRRAVTVNGTPVSFSSQNGQITIREGVPYVARALPDLEGPFALRVGTPMVIADIASLFGDADDDALSYRAFSAAEHIVETKIDDGTLHLNPVSVGGPVAITLVATDGNTQASMLFNVSATENQLSSPPTSVVASFIASTGHFDFGDTAASLSLTDVTGEGLVRVQRFEEGITNTRGVAEQHVSPYYWSVDTTSPLSFGPTSRLVLHLDQIPNSGITSPEKVRMYRRAPSAEEFTLLPTRYESSTNTLIGSELTGFGEFLLASETAPLPVELTGFQATHEKNRVSLRWSTASEEENAGFAVQRRSSTTEDFHQIGFVAGNNTTTKPHTYRFVDQQLPYEARKLRYRLKQIDRNGEFEYSDEIEVALAAPKQFSLLGNFPNPFSTQTTLRYELAHTADIRLVLFNALGRRVATIVDGTQQAGRHEVQFNARDLTSGTYFVHLVTDSFTQTRSLTIVR